MRRFLVIPAAILIAACGEGKIAPIDPGGEGTQPGGGNPGGQQTPTDPPPATEDLSLEAYGPDELDLRPSDQRDIAVRLMSDQAPVADATIDFAIEGDPKGSQLAALESATDASGVAKVRVQAGTTPVTFGIVASTPGTDPVVFRINVAEAAVARGSVTVLVSYSQQREQPLDGGNVLMFDGANTCTALLAAQRLPTAVASRQLQTITSAASFSSLEPGKKITVIAYGTAQGSNAATGCLDGTIVQAGQDVRVTVPLQLRGLDLAGRYDVVTVYDLHEALPGTLGDVFNVAHDIFGDADDPARWIVEWFQDNAFDLGPFDGAAVGLLDNLLRSFLPDSVWTVFDIIRDVTNVVFGLEVHSIATVGPAGPNGNFTVTETWDSLVYMWNQGCQPGDVETCARHEIPLRNTAMGSVTTTYTIHSGGNRTAMIVDPHDIQLKYGLIFQLLLQEVVYPAIAGVHTTGDLLNSYVDCYGIANDLDCGDSYGCDGYYTAGGLIDIEDGTVESACHGAFNAIGAAIDGAIENVGGGPTETMHLEGNAVVTDENRDMKADRWEQGHLTGTVTIDGGKPVSAGMSAIRTGN